jgi:hypothetical protein
MGCKTVAKGVATDSLNHSGFKNCLSNGTLQDSFVDMMPPLFSGLLVFPAVSLGDMPIQVKNRTQGLTQKIFYIVCQPATGSGKSAIWRQDYNRLQGADRNITDKKLLIKNRLQIIFLVNEFCHDIAFTKDNQ